MTNKIKLSIVIVAYKSLDLLEDCFSSILKYNDISSEEIEIILVDNSPEEDAFKIEKFVSDYKSPVVIHYIKNDNLGYGQGNNVGVRHSKGEIIAIMNPDVRLLEPIFKKTISHFDNDEVASVGYSQITGHLNFSFFRFPELFCPILYSFINRKANLNKKFNQNKYSLSGAFVFFRKTDFVDIGMYDEKIFMYLEEPDVAKRINKIGKKVVFDPTKTYQHLMEHKDDFNEKLLDIGTESIKYYFKKYNLNLEKYIRLRIIELKIHTILFGILGKKNKVEKAKAYIQSLKKAL